MLCGSSLPGNLQVRLFQNLDEGHSPDSQRIWLKAGHPWLRDFEGLGVPEGLISEWDRFVAPLREVQQAKEAEKQAEWEQEKLNKNLAVAQRYFQTYPEALPAGAVPSWDLMWEVAHQRGNISLDVEIEELKYQDIFEDDDEIWPVNKHYREKITVQGTTYSRAMCSTCMAQYQE